MQIGVKAPDFTLQDQNGKPFHLAEQAGKKVLLSFHPLAWTGVCRDQMLSLENSFERFSRLNTVAAGLSIDSVPSKKAWADAIGLKKTRILADFWPHGGVAKLYDLFREKDGFSQRANVIIDESQIVIFAKTYPVSQLPDIEEIIRFLETTKG
ncbi:MAG: thioredoxin peroxidase [Chloroflexi bacterium RBG_13_46_9]|nr:MAG: thioredoxin peroxidase [Chloroflexi bacterium RBG_13_46_9]